MAWQALGFDATVFVNQTTSAPELPTGCTVTLHNSVAQVVFNTAASPASCATGALRTGQVAALFFLSFFSLLVTVMNPRARLRR